MGVVVEEEERRNGGRVVPPTGRYGDKGNLVEEVDTTTPLEVGRWEGPLDDVDDDDAPTRDKRPPATRSTTWGGDGEDEEVTRRGITLVGATVKEEDGEGPSGAPNSPRAC